MTINQSSYFHPSSALSVPASLSTSQSASPASVLLPSAPFGWHHRHVTAGTTGGLCDGMCVCGRHWDGVWLNVIKLLIKVCQRFHFEHTFKSEFHFLPTTTTVDDLICKQEQINIIIPSLLLLLSALGLSPEQLPE